MIAFALFGLALSPRVHRHAEASALDVDADEQQMSLTDFEHKFKVDGRFRTVRSPAQNYPRARSAARLQPSRPLGSAAVA